MVFNQLLKLSLIRLSNFGNLWVANDEQLKKGKEKLMHA